MLHEITKGIMTLRLVKGDITHQEVDGIVNAANSSLLGGGGVDGAIHRAGGPEILAECREIRNRQGKCDTGEAVITGAGNLKASKVIHTVGPVWQGGYHGENILLERAYINCLTLARDHSLRRVAFPSVSTGAYGFPIERAALIALGSVVRFSRTNAEAFDEVRFVLFTEGDLAVYAGALEEVRDTMMG